MPATDSVILLWKKLKFLAKVTEFSTLCYFLIHSELVSSLVITDPVVSLIVLANSLLKNGSCIFSIN